MRHISNDFSWTFHLKKWIFFEGHFSWFCCSFEGLCRSTFLILSRIFIIRQQPGRVKRSPYSNVYFLRPPLPKARSRGGRQFLQYFSNVTLVAMIPCALDSPMSQNCNARFLDVFGPFFISLDNFEVATHVEIRRNFDIDLSFIHVTFCKNKRICFSPNFSTKR